jgi:hypothetical protein
VGRSGTSDDQIIPLLHRLNRVTFITLDVDFLDPTLRHQNYCLIFVGTRAGETAHYTRRALTHPVLNTRAKRMGCVVAVSKPGLRLWRWRDKRDELYPWL